MLLYRRIARAVGRGKTTQPQIRCHLQTKKKNNRILSVTKAKEERLKEGRQAGRQRRQRRQCRQDTYATTPNTRKHKKTRGQKHNTHARAHTSFRETNHTTTFICPPLTGCAYITSKSPAFLQPTNTFIRNFLTLSAPRPPPPPPLPPPSTEIYRTPNPLIGRNDTKNTFRIKKKVAGGCLSLFTSLHAPRSV